MAAFDSCASRLTTEIRRFGNAVRYGMTLTLIASGQRTRPGMSPPWLTLSGAKRRSTSALE
jgi:hypothetical protein